MSIAPSRSYLYWLINCQHDIDIIYDAISRYRDSVDIAKIACPIYRVPLRVLGDKMKDNIEIVLLVMQYDAINTVSCASHRIRNDKNLVMQYVHLGGFADIANTLKTDKEAVLRAMNGSGFSLDYVSDELCNDVDVVMGVANSSQNFSLKKLNKRVWSDRNIALALVRKDWRNMKSASKCFTKDREMIMCAVSQSSEALKWVSDEFRGDKEVMRVAVVSLCLYVKLFIPRELRDDADFTTTLIYSNVEWINHCGHKMNKLHDKELMGYVVRHKPLMMYFADGILARDTNLLVLSYMKCETWRLVVPATLQPRGYLVADVLVCLRLA